jgi:hypothetical protein
VRVRGCVYILSVCVCEYEGVSVIVSIFECLYVSVLL